MTFRRVINPDQLAILNTVVDDFCRDTGIEPGSAARDEAAHMAMRFYWAGFRTDRQLRTVLHKAMVWVS